MGCRSGGEDSTSILPIRGGLRSGRSGVRSMIARFEVVTVVFLEYLAMLVVCLSFCKAFRVSPRFVCVIAPTPCLNGIIVFVFFLAFAVDLFLA